MRDEVWPDGDSGKVIILWDKGILLAADKGYDSEDFHVLVKESSGADPSQREI